MEQWVRQRRIPNDGLGRLGKLYAKLNFHSINFEYSKITRQQLAAQANFCIDTDAIQLPVILIFR